MGGYSVVLDVYLVLTPDIPTEIKEALIRDFKETFGCDLEEGRDGELIVFKLLVDTRITEEMLDAFGKRWAWIFESYYLAIKFVIDPDYYVKGGMEELDIENLSLEERLAITLINLLRHERFNIAEEILKKIRDKEIIRKVIEEKLAEIALPKEAISWLVDKGVITEVYLFDLF